MESASAPPPSESRSLAVRGAIVVVALVLIALWVYFARGFYASSTGRPPPAVFMLPVFYCLLAGSAALSALRGEGFPVVIAGGLSLVPAGVVLAFVPGPTRWIALLDVLLIAAGVVLMRAEPVGEAESAS